MPTTLATDAKPRLFTIRLERTVRQVIVFTSDAQEMKEIMADPAGETDDDVSWSILEEIEPIRVVSVTRAD
jgi:hypothetical protein